MTEANLSETAAAIRTHLLETLRLFASPAAQRAYQVAVPFVDVPSELACCWANDLYHPKSPAHALAFSPADQVALAEFDAALGRWTVALPADGLEEFIASSIGAELARAAADALQSLGVEQDAEADAAPDSVGM